MRTVSADGERLLRAARNLAPKILAVRDEIESERRLPERLVEDLRAAHLFELWLPEALGGPALHPLDFLPIIEALSGADGSAGWCAIIGSAYSLFAGSLNEPAAREIFADHAIVAGTINPTGKAAIVDGGYRVTGRWAYGSGIDHSQWVLGNCVVHDDAGPRRLPSGAPDMRFMFFPRADVAVIDTWRVGGLRGTGSHDFTVEGLFVPAYRTMPAFAALGLQPGTLYRMPLLSLLCFALAAVTLGIARSAIGAFVEFATSKVPMGSQVLLRDRPSAQADVARAEAMVRAARAAVVEAIETQWEEVAAGGAPSLDARAGVRLATTFAGEACVRAIELVYNAAGGSAILESGRLDRCFRDARVAVQHIGLTTSTYELAGRVLLGLEPGTLRF
jgi:alkylation response protein AidB-like acyl-CoA dehydrogenase